MDSNLFSSRNVIVQGITGSHGSFHTAAMRAAGTTIVAGTSPSKAGEIVDGVPVYASIADIKQDHQVDISVIFVPASHAKSALFEAITEKVPLIICITEGIPVHDMIIIKQAAIKAGVTLIGPNCPGVLLPGINKLGIIPASMGLPGSIGLVSRSGTLTYEVAAGLSHKGIGQRYIIGIGGDRVKGAGFIDCLQLFEKDETVTQIIMIGEIGGTEEIEAAHYIQEHVTKPVYGYIAGHHAPTGVQLGHAGAILGGDGESAQAKTEALSQAGVVMSKNTTQLIASVKMV